MQQKKRTRKKKHTQYDVIYGAHAITEMLKAKKRKLVSIYTTKPPPKAWDRIKPHLPTRIPNIQYVSRNILSSMAQSHEHMGIVALTLPFPLRKKLFSPETHPRLLLLDGIQDVGNLGGILRSAYCTGINGVVLGGKGAAPLTPAVFKTSAGLAEHLDIVETTSIHTSVIELKKAGYSFYMAVVNKGKNALDVEYKKPYCLVIGNEAKGISAQIAHQGELITLPQQSAGISYNASVATGILLFLLAYKK